jgi:glycosyltransferase involved in cell wall biosynthesis
MKNKYKISGIIIVHNEDKVVKEALVSLKGAVDEIIVIHDGTCKDNTLKIAKKYTKKVYTTKHKGRSAFNFITALEKTSYDWVLKLDADESLSQKLRKNLKNLVKEKNVDAFSFIHPLWDGGKAFTKTWPRKTILVKKSKISYLAFPGFDASIPIKGETRKTDYIVYHKPIKNQDVGWTGFKEKVLKRYAPSQAKFLLKDFNFFETYQYSENKFPLRIRVRRHLPILTNIPYAFLGFLKQMFKEGAWREGSAGFNVALKTLIYNIYLGFLMQKEKLKRK